MQYPGRLQPGTSVWTDRRRRRAFGKFSGYTGRDYIEIGRGPALRARRRRPFGLGAKVSRGGPTQQACSPERHGRTVVDTGLVRRGGRGSVSRLGLAMGLVMLWAGLLPAARGASSLLERLYDSFLTGGSGHCFVGFERRIEVPRMRRRDRRVELPNGRVGTIHFWDHDYLAYLVRDGKWLVAFSSRKPLPRWAAVAEAQELGGFDGQTYWKLRQDHPIKIKLQGTNQDAALPPLLSLNPLTIIPTNEASRAQGKYQADVKLASLLRLLLECRSVVQLGFTNEWVGRPRLEQGRLRVPLRGGKVALAYLQGDPRHPSALAYTNTATARNTVVHFDYTEDTLTVTRRFREHTLFQARYQVLGFEAFPSVGDAEVFSWRHYERHTPNVFAMVVTNGATVELTPTARGEWRPGRVLDPPRPIRSPVRRPAYALYMVYVIGLLLALPVLRWVYRRIIENRRNTGRTHV